MTESPPPSTRTDERLTTLLDWLNAQPLPAGCLPGTARPASSDASFRRYFRVDTNGTPASLILMDAPPPQEDCRPFVHAAAVFAGAGLRVPTVYASDLTRGFLVLSDLGGRTLLQEVSDTPERADARYRQACGELVKLQRATTNGVFAPYDRDKLTAEIRLFDQWYLKHHCKTRLAAATRNALHRCYNHIIDVNLSEATVYVHRDFHSRNLMTADADTPPSVLDFQDAVIGPISYDLVSLLRDAYVCWPEEQVLDWSIRYWEQARDAGLPVPADFGEFWTQFEFMGIQRHLKVLGIFARLNYRDNKSNYLADIPQVLAYTKQVAARYEALQPLSDLLEQLPVQAAA